MHQLAAPLAVDRNDDVGDGKSRGGPVDVSQVAPAAPGLVIAGRGSDVVLVRSSSRAQRAGHVQKEVRTALDVADEQP
jgi:hypothetical protein